MRRLIGSSVVLASLVFYSPDWAYSEGQDRIFRAEHANSIWSNAVSTFFSSARNYAIVIGISDYIGQSNGGYPSLATEKDAENVKEFLLHNQGYDYVHVLTNSEATKEKIESIMTDEMPGLVGPSDRFLFYFSGHGDQFVRPDTKEAFGFLPVYNSKARVFSSMISMDDIRRWNQYLQARHVLFILDACFSGLAGVNKKGSPRIEQLTQPARYPITAGTAGEEIIASEKWNGSLFTHELISVVNDGIGATDGVISVFSLIDTIQSRVSAIKNNVGWQKGLTPQVCDLQGSDGAFFFQVTSKSSGSSQQPEVDKEKIGSKGLKQVLTQDLSAVPAPLVASDLEQRDKTYADLADAEKQAAGSGDAGQVDKSLENIQKAVGDFPGDSRFSNLLDRARTVANAQLRDKAYADLADAEKQAAASGDAGQVDKSLENIQKAVGDFPGDSRFSNLLDRARTVANARLRDKTYADLDDAEKQAAGSGDAGQVDKSLESIQKAVGDFPGDSRFSYLLDRARTVANDLRLRDKTYADLAAAERRAAESADAGQVEKSLESIQKAIGDFPLGDFPDRMRFSKLLDQARKVANDLQLRDRTYADLADAEKQAAASGDAGQVEKSKENIQKAVGDFPGDSRFSKLLDQARKVANDLQLRDRTYADLADAEKQAAASGDAGQVEKSKESIQKAVGDFPDDSRFS